jgi:Flp pilus assembly secretin CpaC
MIEAKILEVKLNDEQSFGIDWEGFFSTTDGVGSFGLQGLGTPGSSGSSGFFFDFLSLDYDVALRALEADGRVRNLASPKVVTVENEEAEVIIGDRRGYAVTTTINQVTTESIEFLESGVILRVTPSVDDDGKILLNIHPEVSNGTVDENGIPSQTTTEVTTRLLVNSGESVFIGGLMRNQTTQGRAGIPILGRIPGLRWLFSNRTQTTQNTETVVLITPRLVDEEVADLNDRSDELYEDIEREVLDKADKVEDIIEDTFGKPAAIEPTAFNEESVDMDADQVTTSVEGEALIEDAAPTVDSATTPPAVSESSSVETSAAAVAAADTASEDAPAPAAAEPASTARYVVNLHSDLAPVERPSVVDELAPDRLLYISEADLDGDIWYRLRLGFFETETDAGAVRDQFLDEYPSAWVTKVGPRERESAADNGL